MTAHVKSWLEADGRLLRLRLTRPKSNLIDADMIAALDAKIASQLQAPHLHAVLLDADGPNFSFGASVEEHLPEQCNAMLAALHALILRMLASPVPILVAIHGRCLGGGLELALAGHLLFAAPTSELGQPELKLGVFAPAASCLLPELIGPQRALDLLISGRTITGTEAFGLGLVGALADDPQAAALDYFTQHLSGKSASSLRHAVYAARHDYVERIRAKLLTVECLYLDTLMRTHDAVEGLTAFISKRPAEWKHM